jgi:hypothetical protein
MRTVGLLRNKKTIRRYHIVDHGRPSRTDLTTKRIAAAGGALVAILIVARRMSRRYLESDGRTKIATFHPRTAVKELRELIALALKRTHIAAARVFRIGTWHATLIRLQQIALGIGAAARVACVDRRTSRDKGIV